MGGDSQEAGERGGRSEQRKEKKPRKMASVGNWSSSLLGPEAGVFVYCSWWGGAPGEFPSLLRQKSRKDRAEK